MEENGRWVTMNGAHVFIKDGQSPMDAFIRQKGGENNKIKKITKSDIIVGDIYKGADGYWNYDLKEGIESDYGLPYIWNKTKSGAEQELKMIIQRENTLKERGNKKIFYHTSNNDFTEFDNDRPRQAILGGQYGYGHYFFDDKEISDGYGAYSKYQYETNLNVNKWFNATDKDFDSKLKSLGYNYEKDDIANFLIKKGYDGSMIEHINSTGNKWYEYVVYDSKNIKIINKKKI